MIRLRQDNGTFFESVICTRSKNFFSIPPSDVPYEPCNFPDLTSLIVAFIVFPKYIPDLYVFLISVRIEFFANPPFGTTLPSVQLATRSFSRGTNSPHGDFPDETRYSQFRPTVAGIERQRPHPFCSLSTNRFHVSPRSFHISRISRLISRFKFNFCFFVSTRSTSE